MEENNKRIYNERLYNIFMLIVGRFSNEEIIELANSLIEYVENDNEEQDLEISIGLDYPYIRYGINESEEE